MRLFLVRHGESVDNVAGLYAGSRDSPLTNHGVLQARRLGAHIASRSPAIGPVRRVFSSNLQRASTTAQAVADAQPNLASEPSSTLSKPTVVQLAELREKDFGSGEGKRFGDRTEFDQSDSETHEAMRVRIDRFVEEHLVEALVEMMTAAETKSVMVIVAHGIILNVLLRSILSKFASDELLRLVKLGDGSKKSEYIAAWSNTGYLEIVVENRSPRATEVLFDEADSTEGQSSAAGVAKEVKDSNQLDLKLRVTALNCVEHLQGLKKTRGGIGSAKFDNKQKTMDSFFSKAPKKAKIADEAEP